MLKRALLIYLVANFGLIGLVMWLRGGWYAGLTESPLAGMLAQLGLVVLPNLLLPVLLLRFEGLPPTQSIHQSLGWIWSGRRTVLASGAGFFLFIALSYAVSAWIGEPIPYQVPGVEPLSADTLPQAGGLFVLLFLFVGLTVAAEESMFRGLLQFRFSGRFGVFAGLIAAALLFGLRHLPDDLFYASLWSADSRMWLAREVQLYGGALLFGMARYFGRSTYASAILHVLIFAVALFS